MVLLRSALLAGAAVAVLLGPAWAEAPPAAGDKKPRAVAPKSGVTITGGVTEDNSDTTGEVIEVWDERKEKAFDRDTQLRLTADDLRERGATDLSEALELLPDVYVREAGRGGRQVDVRGARRGQIRVIIDGIGVSDPFYGTFDLTSIPVTDIVQIRVSPSPGSPIDGSGASGAVIEVHTRDAVGGRLVQARLQGNNFPGVDGAVTGRVPLGDRLGLRLSASGVFGSRDFELPPPFTNTIDEARRGAIGAMRLEYRKGKRRVVLDGWAQTRGFVVPPGEDEQMDILVIDRETSGRAGVAFDDQLGKLRLRANGYFQRMTRLSSYYRDDALATPVRSEDLTAERAGALLLLNRPVGRSLHLIASAFIDSEHADVIGFDDSQTGGRASIAGSAVGVQYERGPLRLDSAAGVAVPVGLGADPWPEAKLTVTYRVARPLSLRFIGGHKGRIPTLRERFGLDVGNSALGPEQALHGELGVIIRPRDGMRLEVGSFIRDTNGLIRFDATQASLVNTGDLVVRGFDARARVTLTDHLRAGGSWVFQDASSTILGSNPLDFLPQHRADLWLTGRYHQRAGGTARLRYVSSQIDRSEILASRVWVDLSAYVRVRNDLTASLRVDNVADDRFELRAGGIRAPGRLFTLSLQGTWK